MAAITVKVPQGFPVGTSVEVFTDPSGDVSPKGRGNKGAASVAADGSLSISGLNAGQHYVVGGTVNGVFRTFLTVAR